MSINALMSYNSYDKNLHGMEWRFKGWSEKGIQSPFWERFQAGDSFLIES